MWLPKVYTYLDVSQAPQPADVIVVLGGSDDQRRFYAGELYQAGYAPLVLVSGFRAAIPSFVNNLLQAGVPEQAILTNPDATNTYNEARQVFSILQRQEIESALIVTNRFHTRRVLATYRAVFRDSSIAFTVVSPEDGIEASSWWESRFGSEIASEYLKILSYWLLYGVQPL